MQTFQKLLPEEDLDYFIKELSSVTEKQQFTELIRRFDCAYVERAKNNPQLQGHFPFGGVNNPYSQYQPRTETYPRPRSSSIPRNYSEGRLDESLYKVPMHLREGTQFRTQATEEIYSREPRAPSPLPRRQEESSLRGSIDLRKLKEEMLRDMNKHSVKQEPQESFYQKPLYSQPNSRYERPSETFSYSYFPQNTMQPPMQHSMQHSMQNSMQPQPHMQPYMQPQMQSTYSERNREFPRYEEPNYAFLSRPPSIPNFSYFK